jgi:hypothetical protein
MPAEGIDAGVLSSIQSYLEAHGEYASLVRATPGELRVEVYGQDEVLPGYEPPRTNVVHAVVRVPADAEVVVDEEVATDAADGGSD